MSIQQIQSFHTQFSSLLNSIAHIDGDLSDANSVSFPEGFSAPQSFLDYKSRLEDAKSSATNEQISNMISNKLNEIVSFVNDLESKIEELSNENSTLRQGLDDALQAARDAKQAADDANSSKGNNKSLPIPPKNNKPLATPPQASNMQNNPNSNLEALAKKFSEQDALLDKEPSLNTLSSEDDGSISDSEWAQIQRDSANI